MLQKIQALNASETKFYIAISYVAHSLPSLLKIQTLNLTTSDSRALIHSHIAFSGSWDDVFKVSVGLYLVGTVVWNLFSTGEKILD